MMQSIDAERQLVREVELKSMQRKKYLIATIILALLSAGLLAGLIVLSVVHLRHLEQCNTNAWSPSNLPNTSSGSIGPIGPIVPEAPPLAPGHSKRRFVIATVPNGNAAPLATGAFISGKDSP
ncbi:hypothetical protein KVR01_009006 [Diaporthe batatas]|uniref:uncharacterized protein n=1 Tax=Diaporthe batatas TaxID=748121 RepID=UPI001D03F58A|nr:uncharacterized protein KVR01_009006 [Diaporthe batatas]KAG8160742.1 hypothetical protein KVR01_009006 [Diaporthe batatas]